MATLMQVLIEVGAGAKWIIDSQTGVRVSAETVENNRYYQAWYEHVGSNTHESAASAHLEAILRDLATNAPGITRERFTAWVVREYIPF